VRLSLVPAFDDQDAFANLMSLWPAGTVREHTSRNSSVGGAGPSDHRLEESQSGTLGDTPRHPSENPVEVQVLSSA
jgi:hypothetical protein